MPDSGLGAIWDIEVVGQRAFIAGTHTVTLTVT
jgi:hypothetical protein